MKKSKEFNQLGLSERMNMSEMLGSKVAIIFNKARDKANKILKPAGFEINIKVDFCRIGEVKANEEVTSV